MMTGRFVGHEWFISGCCFAFGYCSPLVQDCNRYNVTKVLKKGLCVICLICVMIMFNRRFECVVYVWYVWYMWDMTHSHQGPCVICLICVMIMFNRRFECVIYVWYVWYTWDMTHSHQRLCVDQSYGVATMSRLLQIVCLFCKRAL